VSRNLERSGIKMTLYDYIYVDHEKVASLYSQLTGGVVELHEINSEQRHSTDDKRRYDFKIFKHDAGGTDEEKSASKAVIKPHHSVLTELEEGLTERGYLVDLTAPSQFRSLRDDRLRNLLTTKLCLKVRGRAVIEDYERVKSITQVYPDILKLINNSVELSLRQSPQFIELQRQLDKIQLEVRQHKNHNANLLLQQQLKDAERSVEQFLSSQGKLGVEPWILDGIKTWIDAFLPGIVNLRIYPSTDLTDEHIFGHLKKNCFQDTDSNSFHFTYGSVPTEALTLVGIVTSVPTENGDTFKPLIEFEKETLADYESIENVFRGMFRGFDGIEQMIRTCRFPRVLVQPLMVYRSVDQ
jgi:hypothetical protein